MVLASSAVNPGAPGAIVAGLGLDFGFAAAGEAATRAAEKAAGSSARELMLPGRGLVVLQELAGQVDAGVEAGEDGIDDAGCAVDDVERRLEVVLRLLAAGEMRRVLVRHPARVHGRHVDAVLLVVGRRGERQ